MKVTESHRIFKKELRNIGRNMKFCSDWYKFEINEVLMGDVQYLL